MIIDRIRFEKTCDKKEDTFVALYREHNTLLIILFAALFFYCLTNYINI